MALIEVSLEELPVSANLGQSCLATKISAPGPSSFGWFRHTMADDEVGRAAEEEERGKGKRAAWRKRQGACRGRRGSAGRTSEEEERGGRAHGVERERRERAAER